MDPKKLTEQILKLKEEKNAVILAHNYQRPEIQDLGDYLGDSLDLARKVQSVDEDLIVFCGVDFMVETASIINPEKTIIIPAYDAMCPMAAMLPVEVLRNAKKKHPEAQVVMYVNTLAAVKVYADCMCTSTNALKAVNSMESDTVLFAPDKNLAHYVRKQTDKEIIVVPEEGICIVHDNIKVEDIKEVIEKHPNAKITVHPETPPQVQELADHTGGTNDMIKYVKKTDAKEFIIGTENGIIHRMKKEAPGKAFYPACKKAICKNMKKITLKHLYEALKNTQYVVKVPEEIAEKARKPIQRMLDLK